MESSEQLRSACKIMFGSQVENAEALLNVLDLSAIEAIYRHKASAQGTAQGDSSELLDLAYERVKQFKLVLRASAGEPSPGSTGEPEPPRADFAPVTDGFWTGPLPPRHLLFGHFLYYSGRISRMTLEKAIAWQRKQRPLFGQLAIESGYATADSIAEVLSKADMNELIGEACVRLGVMNDYQRAAVLGRQRAHQRRLDNFFIEQGILGPMEARELFAKQRLHNIRKYRKPASERS